jgi:hypothetical protein
MSDNNHSDNQTRRREQSRILMRQARQRMTPEQCEQQRASDRKRKKAARLNRLRPFWGVDGEGAGRDGRGRQHYVLMAASGPGAHERRIKHRDDGGPLSVIDCLEFLLSLSREPILVGFAFGYDANQIIRGIRNPKDRGRDPFETLRRIIRPPQGQYGPRSTFWGEYAIRAAVALFPGLAHRP